MSNLRDLYQQVIIDHSKNPRNCCVCENANHMQEGFNPLCGDHLTVTLYVDAKSNIITDICFQGQGCAIAMASASLMTEAVKGKTVAEALHTFAQFQKLVTSPVTAPVAVAEQPAAKQFGEMAAMAAIAVSPIAAADADSSSLEQLAEELGKLAVFTGVREFPIRIKCATLAWHTLKAALEEDGGNANSSGEKKETIKVTTE